MRRPIAVAGLLAVALALTGCRAGLSEAGEPLTIEQSEMLAQARFRVATEGARVLEISIGAAGDIDHLELDVTYDPVSDAAWGTMLRGPEGLAVTERVAFSPDAFAQLAGGEWTVGDLAAGPSPMLAVVFVLSSDRPENAQLLRQSDARFLGSVDVDGEHQQVYRMPSADGGSVATSRLWLDEDGRMRRVDAGDDEALVILLTDEEPQPPPDGLVIGEGGAADG
ncbi:hypothetical protein [Microbacterium tumbae]